MIVDNGDIGYQGRAEGDRVMMTGNNHGSIEQINGQWYVFYHRQTNLNTFSRQGCAEKITIRPDGRIDQAEITSCGLNGGPLAARGVYPASICCCLTNGHMPHIGQQDWTEPMPVITHAGAEHFLSGISDGVTVGYKYFAFDGLCALRITCRGTAVGRITVALDDRACGEIAVHPAAEWTEISGSISAKGSRALYFTFHGEGSLDIKELGFND